MKQFFKRLNLRPQELRLVVVVAAILFVFLNLWLVRPHFKDWKLAREGLAEAQTTLKIYQRETDPARIAAFKATLKQLEGSGSAVLPTEQPLDLIRTIQNQAGQSGVVISSQSAGTTLTTKTNEFFEEQARQITVFAGEKELVNFLVSLGSSNSMIRVRDINLRPDPTQMKLQGRITLVASYQKSRTVKNEPAVRAPTAATLAPRIRERPKKQ